MSLIDTPLGLRSGRFTEAIMITAILTLNDRLRAVQNWSMLSRFHVWELLLSFPPSFCN